MTTNKKFLDTRTGEVVEQFLINRHKIYARIGRERRRDKPLSQTQLKKRYEKMIFIYYSNGFYYKYFPNVNSRH